MRPRAVHSGSSAIYGARERGAPRPEAPEGGSRGPVVVMPGPWGDESPESDHHVNIDRWIATVDRGRRDRARGTRRWIAAGGIPARGSRRGGSPGSQDRVITALSVATGPRSGGPGA
jgi:hypothetical protein